MARISKISLKTILIMAIAFILCISMAYAADITLSGKIIGFEPNATSSNSAASDGNIIEGIAELAAEYSAIQSSNMTVITEYSGFASDSETTSLESEPDPTNVSNMTLAVTNKGKIKFAEDYGINILGADYDKHVKMADKVIFVNSSALHPSFNSSATLTFYNVDCNAPYVYYSDTETTSYKIMAENNICLAPRCTNIQCSENTLTVDVAHFSGYAVNGSANLSIDADDPKFIDELVTFTAIYMNLTGGFINGADCSISFADGSYIMDEQSGHYNYTKSFAAAQTVDYNVTCNKTGYNTVFANDTALIQSTVIPEFSTITLGLGLIAVLLGLFIIRRKT